jgi:predicted SnoaL-like aldol condensation-catalyzing enzyme
MMSNTGTRTLAGRTFLVAAMTCGTSALAQAPPRCAEPPEQVQRAAFNQFVDTLLIDRNARKAFETHAVAELKQHAAAFGKDRESTIKQFEGLLGRPGSTYTIKAVSFESGLGTIRMHGIMNPGQPGAEVVNFFRFQCGKIVEAWDILRFDAPPPAPKN